jgi:16S rRNA (guanine527-N7)-methyltransferase
MRPARIAELLEPFLHLPATADPDHSELKTFSHHELKPSGHSELKTPGHSELKTSRYPELKTSCHSESGRRPGEEPAVPAATTDHRLTTNDLDHISTYIDILLRWNARINLTAIRDPEAIVTRHFGESLFAARHLFPRTTHVETAAETLRGRAALQGRVNTQIEAGALAPEAVANDQRPSVACPERGEGTNDRLTLADLGSGAGFPGLPIKLWAPHISLTLIESNHKKAAFLREVTRALTLTDVNIQNARAETLTTTFDLVTLRAVERFETILPTAASLVAPVGRLALLISSLQQDQARSTLPHLQWSNPVPIPQSRSRVLLVANRAD